MELGTGGEWASGTENPSSLYMVGVIIWERILGRTPKFEGIMDQRVFEQVSMVRYGVGLA